MAMEAGIRVASAAAHGKNGHSLISDAKLRQLFEVALQLQLGSEGADAEGAAWLRGREAALAGVVADLRGSDVVVAEYAAGVNEILRGQLSLRMDGRSFEERVIEALCDAVGDRMRKTGRITAIFVDGRQGGKILQEARALAIAAKLPVLLVEHARPERRSAAKKGKKTAAIEYPSIPVDTQDVIAMYRVAHESIARARDGGGPTHMVGLRWRLAASGRAGKAATEGAVEHLERWLIARGLPAQEWRREMAAAFAARGGRSFEAQSADGAMDDEDTETQAIA
jgi:hypothetical protein